jgi:hypothetical protein
LATLGVVAPELERGELAVLPLVEPLLAATFAIARVADRSLPAIADDIARAIVDADRKAHVAESMLCERWLGGSRAPRRATTVRVA